MNHVYRVIWNASRQVWMAVGELAKAQGKGKSAVSTASSSSLVHILSGSLLLIPATLFAGSLPSGGEVRAGQGIISESGNEMVIHQSSDRLVIDWQQFSIAEGSQVEFIQPGSDAAALNRVLGSQVSSLQGALRANGQVFLINPNGIVFGSNAQVDVGGLVASTLSISPEDFMAGNLSFEGADSNAIINRGNIRAAEGGYVAMIAAEIINTGNIDTPRGDVLMGAGSRITLDLGGPVKIEVEEALLDTYIEQGGAIKADGGLVYLTAKAVGDLASSVINHTGVTEARTLASGENGEIVLIGDMEYGETQAAGTLAAHFVETSAAKVTIDQNLKVETDGGEWLLDPANITIDSSKASAIQSALGSGDVTVTTADGGDNTGWSGGTNGSSTDEGNINVDASIEWSSNVLTLTADNDIIINAELTSSGTTASDGLVLQYAQTSASGDYSINAPVNLAAGSLFKTQHASDAEITYTVITSLGTAGSTSTTDLQGINGDRAGHYVLGADINAGTTSGWNSGAGFNPLRNFTGTFDGLGHTISGLTIDRPSSVRNTGLFGRVSGAYIRNIGLVGGSVVGKDYVGGLVGRSKDSTISDAYVTGSVTGVNSVGGLVGRNDDSTISNAYATGDVTGTGDYVGGLVGMNYYDRVNSNNAFSSNIFATGSVNGAGDYVGGLAGMSYFAPISYAYATGSVNGTGDYVGGLAGMSYFAPISYAYATGSVKGSNKVGGLVGLSYFAPISYAYATGSVKGSNKVGGLVGRNHESPISNAFATGSVMGSNYVGGLMGEMYSASISNAYATGSVTGTGEHVGGLVGVGYFSTYTASFWGKETSGQASGNGVHTNGQTVTGLSTAQMQDPFTFINAGWDFETVWGKSNNTATPENSGYMMLHGVGVSGALYDDYVSFANTSKTYGNVNPVIPGFTANSIGTANVTVTSIDWGSAITTTTDAGTYAYSDTDVLDATIATTSANGVYVGYGNLIIDKASLTITANDAAKTYDGQAFSGGNGVSYDGFVAGDDESVLGGLLAYSGTAQGAVNSGDYTLGASGLLSANYDLTYHEGTLTVNKAALSVTANDDAKTYDGAAYSGGNGVSYDGFVAGDDESVLGGLLAYSGTAQGAMNSGDYTLGASGLLSANYDLTYHDGTLTVNKAALNVTANDAAKTYDGQAFSGGNGVSYDGFVAGEDENVLGGLLVYGGTAQGAVDSGDYTLGAAGLLSANYDLTYHDGTLAVNKAALSVTANDAAKTYDGQAFSGGNGVSYDGFVAGEDENVLGGLLVYGGTAQGAVDSGDYTLGAAGLLSANYDLTYHDGTLAVNKAALNVTANDAAKTYDGQAFSGGNGVSYTGFVNGEDSSVLGGSLSYGGDAQNAVNAGSYDLIASGLSADNYEIAYVDGTLIVKPLTALGDDAINQALQLANSTIETVFDGYEVVLLDGANPDVDINSVLASATGIRSPLKLFVIKDGIRLADNAIFAGEATQ